MAENEKTNEIRLAPRKKKISFVKFAKLYASSSFYWNLVQTLARFIQTLLGVQKALNIYI